MWRCLIREGAAKFEGSLSLNFTCSSRFRGLSCKPNNQLNVEPLQKVRAMLGPSNRFKPPVIFNITDRSKAVLLIWFSVFVFAGFGVCFCTVSPSECLDDI